MKNLPIVFRVLLGLPMVIFGLDKFLSFIPMDAPVDGTLHQVYVAGYASSYLIKLVGITEIIGGLLVLLKRTSALGTIILMPVLVNIFAYNFTVFPTAQGQVLSLLFTFLAIGVLFFNKRRLLPIIGEQGAK